MEDFMQLIEEQVKLNGASKSMMILSALRLVLLLSPVIWKDQVFVGGLDGILYGFAIDDHMI